MGWKNMFANMFAEKERNETFTEARTQLERLKNHIAYVSVVLGDEISQLVFFKNKWQVIPCDMGVKTKFIALEITDSYNIILNVLESGAKMYHHKHVNNYETLKVIDGSIELIINGKHHMLDVNSPTWTFKPGTEHTINSTDGAKFIVCFSEDPSRSVIYDETILMAKKF